MARRFVDDSTEIACDAASSPRISPTRLTKDGLPKGLWRKRCTATSRQTGRRCGNYAIPGLTCCRFHGGGTAAARAAGRRRIAAQVATALDTLVALLDNR